MVCGSFLWFPLDLIPPWRAAINPSVSAAPGSGCLVCCMRIFVAENVSPNSSPKVFIEYWRCLVSADVPNRWKGSLFKLFAVKWCGEGCICCIGPEDRVPFYYICSRGFPGKCSASISVCKEILLSGQSNK